MNNIFTWEMVVNLQTSVENCLFRVPGMITKGKFCNLSHEFASNFCHMKAKHMQHQPPTATPPTHKKSESGSAPPCFKEKTMQPKALSKLIAMATRHIVAKSRQSPWRPALR